MTFTNILAGVTWLLLTERFVSYRRISREFDLDNAALQDVRHELIQVKRVAADQNGEFLVWALDAATETDAQSIELRPLPALTIRTGQQRQDDPGLIGDVAARKLAAATEPAEIPSDAERRPLTVMFCDLADSTALSTKLDPEDLQDVIRTYQDCCTAIVQELGGYVAKYMGDGILVYFGYPKSLERDAERAVRAGLAIIEAMAEVNNDLGRKKEFDIAVRIGIATGLVVVGEVVGEGLAQERTVVGEAPNIAARLQGLAARNGLVIGALTREITGDAFVYEDLGGHEL